MRDFAFVILGAIIGFFSQWMWTVFQERRQRRRGPNVVIAKFEQTGQVFLDVHNLGPDGLAEMDVFITWLADSHLRTHQLKKFFRLGLAQTNGTPVLVEYMAADERLRIGDVPTDTDDGLVSVRVTGVGQLSRRLYETQSQIAVRLKKKGETV